MDLTLYHAISNIILAMPLENHPKKYYSYPHILIVSDSSSAMKPLFFFLIVCLLVCAIDHGVNEGEPVDEQYRKQVNKDQFRDSEPKG